MQGDPIPPEHHVLRYAAPNRLAKDDNEMPVGLKHTALQLRPGEAYLSVQWSEYFSDGLLASCHQAIRAHADSGSFTPGKNGAYGLAKVADLLAVAATHRPPARLRVAHEPEENNPPHAGIHGLPAEDQELLEALAFDAFTSLIRVSDVPGL